MALPVDLQLSLAGGSSHVNDEIASVVAGAPLS